MNEKIAELKECLARADELARAIMADEVLGKSVHAVPLRSRVTAALDSLEALSKELNEQAS